VLFRSIWHLLALGVVGAGLPDLFLVESIRRAGAIIPIMLARIEIPLGVLFAHIFLKEKVGKIAYVAALASFGGAALITFPNGFSSIDTSSDFFIGVLFGLAAAVVWGIASVYAKFMLSNKDVDPLVLSFVRMLTGSVFNFILVFIFVSGPLLVLSKLSLFDWTMLLYIGIFLSGIAYLTFYKALKVLDAHILMISLSVSMIINLILGLVLGETIVLMQYVGIALIGFSIFLIYNSTKK
jgi:drug/metabolite transporter (DMT)-like permease